jgi:hypothetical protein
LRDEPLIRSGREANYEAGKDTGRFWDSGARNVHWVIVGEDQVEQGINEALLRVQTAGVIVEGNSFLDYVEAHFAIMCARAGENRLKTSARRILEKANAIYLSTVDECDEITTRQRFDEWCASLTTKLDVAGLPVFTPHGIDLLVENIKKIQLAGSLRTAGQPALHL